MTKGERGQICVTSFINVSLTNGENILKSYFIFFGPERDDFKLGSTAKDRILIPPPLVVDSPFLDFSEKLLSSLSVSVCRSFDVELDLRLAASFSLAILAIRIPLGKKTNVKMGRKLLKIKY